MNHKDSKLYLIEISDFGAYFDVNWNGQTTDKDLQIVSRILASSTVLKDFFQSQNMKDDKVFWFFLASVNAYVQSFNIKHSQRLRGRKAILDNITNYLTYFDTNKTDTTFSNKETNITAFNNLKNTSRDIDILEQENKLLEDNVCNTKEEIKSLKKEIDNLLHRNDSSTLKNP